jgi:hypothetical protein
MKKMFKLSVRLFLLLLIPGIFILTKCNSDRNENDVSEGRIKIIVNKKRVNPGDTLIFKVLTNSLKHPDHTEVFLNIPTRGIEKLLIKRDSENKNLYEGKIVLHIDNPDGLYGITAVNISDKKHPIGKAAFLKGKVVLDFAIMANFADSGTVSDMTDYLNGFIKIGGNAITLHGNIASEKEWNGRTRVRAVWASNVCKNAVLEPEDKIEKMLNLTDKMGIPSFLSVSWDLSDSTLLNNGYINSIKDIIDELWNMFGHHPSLVGFYSYQEGSGTYFANYVRDFCKIVKRNNTGLLTMCAPNIDDPLLAGYLAAIDELDIINYQAPIMTSYRPDNRKMFPNRRVKDVTSLSAGATRVRDKITLSHVEFMGYLENRVADAYLTDYNNIFNQFPSVASAFGPDGITFFSYFSCIYFNSKKLPAETEKAALGVTDGLKAYQLISKQISNRSSHVALYIPYNDWCIERWSNCFLPATDALCKLGISPDILPFIPREGEDILPFYPMNINQQQLDYILNNKYVMILPDISGMQETDSELLEAFVRKGGVVIAFGPRIPYGDRFDRVRFWGAEEIRKIQANSEFNMIKVLKSPGFRAKQFDQYKFFPVVSTTWNPPVENRIADFQDGSAAIFSNKYQKGKTYVVSLSLKEAVNNFPDLLRDILDEALSKYGITRSFDVYGIRDNMDVAMNEDDEKRSVMVANYGNDAVKVEIKPLFEKSRSAYSLIDMKSGKEITEMIAGSSETINMKVEANNFIAISLVLKRSLK